MGTLKGQQWGGLGTSWVTNTANIAPRLVTRHRLKTVYLAAMHFAIFFVILRGGTGGGDTQCPTCPVGPESDITGMECVYDDAVVFSPKWGMAANDEVYHLDTMILETITLDELRSARGARRKELDLVVTTARQTVEKRAGVMGVESVQGGYDARRRRRFYKVWMVDRTNLDMLERRIINIELPMQTNACVSEHHLADKKPRVNFIVSLKNMASRFMNLADYVSAIFLEGDDVRLVVVDYDSQDANIARIIDAMQFPALLYTFPSETAFSRSGGLMKGASLVEGDDEIIFFIDVDMGFPLDFAQRIRDHCIRGQQIYAPVAWSTFKDGSSNHKKPGQGFWRTGGFGMMGMYKGDLKTLRGYDTQKFTTKHGGEDIDLANKILMTPGYVVSRPLEPDYFHAWHAENDWKESDGSQRPIHPQFCGSREYSFPTFKREDVCMDHFYKSTV